jgi:hypothetical protein
MKRLQYLLPSGLVLVLALSFTALAADLTPDFTNAPTGWFTDRYKPAAFQNIGTFEGAYNVLQIGISAADGEQTRPAPYQSDFYNTQGMGYNIGGGAGSDIAARLYVPQAWSDPTDNGNVRTDMWGVMWDGTNVTDYPIIGFTNYGGAPRYRVYDPNTGNWIDSTVPVVYDAWTTFTIAFTGTSYQFYVGATLIDTLPSTNGATGFKEVIMQAYNFDGTSFTPAAVPSNYYTADWANVPEPGSFLLVGGAMIALVALSKRVLPRR